MKTWGHPKPRQALRPGPAVRRWRSVALALAIVAAVAYPIPFQVLGSTYFQIVGFLVLLYAMLSVGWNFVGGWAGQFDFGPSLFFAIGAYTMVVLLTHLGVNPWLGMVAGAAVAALVCALVTYPITKLRGHYFAIATVAMWMIARPIGQSWDFINGSTGIFIPMRKGDDLVAQIVNLQFTGPTKEMANYYVTLAMFAMVMYLAHLVHHSKLGYCFQAIRDDQDGAEAIGINSRTYKVIARCMTAAVFAVGGVLYVLWVLAVFPEQVLEMNWGILPTLALVLGGLGRPWGAVLGVFILIPLSQYMSTMLGTGPLAGRGIDVIVYSVLIMLVAALRPNGILSLPWGQWARGVAGVVRSGPVAATPDPGGRAAP